MNLCSHLAGKEMSVRECTYNVSWPTPSEITSHSDSIGENLIAWLVTSSYKVLAHAVQAEPDYPSTAVEDLMSGDS